MFGFHQLSTSALLELSRHLRHGLHAGFTVLDVLRQQAKRGTASSRAVAAELTESLERGETLEEALQSSGRFPRLFVALLAAGELAGRLPEVCRELEDYYQLQLSLRRQFVSQLVWPVFQFVAAVGVIALVILVLGLIAEAKPEAAIDPLGLGLTGVHGAIVFLSVVAGSLIVLAVLGWTLWRLRSLTGIAIHLLRVPFIGPTLQALALMRFALALRVTLEAGLSVSRVLRRSLAATGNPAFEQSATRAVALVKRGQNITEALRATRVFPEEFLATVMLGEETGQLPEVMARQSDHYHEEAARRLAALTRAASFAVWLGVAVFIVLAIFRIAGVYIDAINGLA